MKKIILSLTLILSIATAAYCQEASSYKPSTISFSRIMPDTLDVLVKKIGKDSVLKILDLRIKNATLFVKYGTGKLKNIIPAQELSAYNKHFKLNIESSFDFTNIPGKIFADSTGSSLKVYDEIKALTLSNESSSIAIAALALAIGISSRHSMSSS
mgnify:CR=1 FL=1